MHHPRHRSTTTGLLAAALVLAILPGIVACGPTARSPLPSPTSSEVAPPLYATDEEALAAAEAVYREYLEATNAGPDLEGLAAVTTPAWFEYEKGVAERRRADGTHAVGASVLIAFDLQMRTAQEIVAYACIDVSDVRILDQSGADVTPPDRPERGTLEVRFAVTPGGPRVDGSDLWSNSCS